MAAGERPSVGPPIDSQENYTVATVSVVAAIRFEWDSEKADANRRKHGVSFAEAQTTFFDEEALLLADPDHSDAEDRFVLLGLSASLRLLLVCHCYRQGGRVIRIIAARKADRRERRQYAQRWSP